MDRALYDAAFLRKLERLALVSRRLYRGEGRGMHRSMRRGASPDFADHRAYQPGDDLRSMDWNVYGRLGRLFVKLFVDEEDVSVHILLDTSRSMGFGNPSKMDAARRVGAALGYIGITALDRVGMAAFAAGVGQVLAPRRGRAQFHHLIDRLSRLAPAGGTDFSRSLEQYAQRAREPGIAVVISDLLDPGGCERGLAALRYRGFDVVLVQILDREEISPTIHGALRLADAETGRSLSVTVDSRLLSEYHARVNRHLTGLESFCLRAGIEYLRASTLVPFEDIVLKYLRQGAHLHTR
jgi:uncharacterized protein (DUF58 family)